MTSPIVRWIYYHDKWTTFDSVTHDILEHGYINSKPSVVYTINNQKYTADLHTLSQLNHSTSSHSEIDRIQVFTGPNGMSREISLKAQYMMGLIGNTDVALARTANGSKNPGPASFTDSDDDENTGMYDIQDTSDNDNDVLWEFNDQGFIPYNDSNEIEKLYKQVGPSGTADYSYGQHSYKLNFATMTQTNTSTNVARTMKRTP